MLFKNDDDGIPSDVSDYAARPVNGSVVGDDEYLIEWVDDENDGGRKLLNGSVILMSPFSRRGVSILRLLQKTSGRQSERQIRRSERVW